VLQTLSGLEGLNDCLFEGKILRQLGRGQMGDGGNDISGFFVVADGGGGGGVVQWTKPRFSVG